MNTAHTNKKLLLMVLTYYLDGLQNYTLWCEHHDHLKFLHSKGMATYTYGCTIKTLQYFRMQKATLYAQLGHKPIKQVQLVTQL